MQVYLPIAELTVNILLFLGMGGAVGFLSGMFGVGGGFLLTPLLIFSGIPPAVAVASVTPQIVASSTSAAISYWRRKLIDEKMTALLAAGGMVGSATGVYTFRALRSVGQLDLILAIAYVTFLGFIGTIMLRESVQALWRSRGGRSAAARRSGHHSWIHGLPLKTRFRRSKLYVSIIPVVALGGSIGFLGTVLGMGGGFIMVPALIYLLRVPTNVVIGTSLAYTLLTMSLATGAACDREQVRRHHAGARPDGGGRDRRAVRCPGRTGAAGRAIARASGADGARGGGAGALQPVHDARGSVLAHRRRRPDVRALAAAILLMALGAGQARAESLVATLSDAAVEITSSFTGEQIVVFGAIDGATESPEPYQIAVVVQGPDQDVTVRHKERFLGIWANRGTRNFPHVPSYYVMHLNDDFSDDPAPWPGTGWA